MAVLLFISKEGKVVVVTASKQQYPLCSYSGWVPNCL